MSTLSAFLDERLRVDGATRLDDINAPPWWEDGVTVAVDEATYMEYLEMFPPRYIHGTLFAFGEGSGGFTLIWEQDRRYFVHQLSLDDTETFCRLSGAALHQ